MSGPSDPVGGPARPPRRGGAGDGSRPGSPGAVPAAPAEGALGGSDHAEAWADPAGEPPASDEHLDDYDDIYDDDLYEDDDDYVDLPGEGSVPKWLAVSAVAVLLVVAVVGGAWIWYQRQVNPPGSPGKIVRIEVPSGASTSGIGSILEDKGVISNSTVFSFYAGRKDVGGFQAGVYELRENSDFDLVLRTLEKGPVEPLRPKVVKLSLPEGYTVAQITARIAQVLPRADAETTGDLLTDKVVESSLRPDGQNSYEGLFFPATYELDPDATAQEVLDKLAGEMESRVEGLDVDAARARIKEKWGIDLSAYDLLKVASMVQAEAGNADEAPKIATVIYNRLRDRMPLGIDAVDRYGAKLAGVEVDYTDESAPYNTRRKAGLPPTPISAPGDFALKAAFEPADGPWLFYVLEEARKHVFVTTNAEFLAAKARCRERNLGCG